MEALRNHVQHSSSAVHKISGSYNKAIPVAWSERLSFYATKPLLEQAGGFKAKVLQEMPQEVDLRLAAREYIERLSAAHVALRVHVAPAIAASREAFENAISKYKAAGADSALGLQANPPDGLNVQPVLIMLEWDDVREALVRKNARPVSMAGK